MKLVNDQNLIAKKMKISEIISKPILYTSKESQEHVEFRFRKKKYDLLAKIRKNIFISHVRTGKIFLIARISRDP